MATKNLALKRATSSVKRYKSFKELDFDKNPSQYFDSLRVRKGEFMYQGTTYTLKKIPITAETVIDDLPEVQIIKNDYKNPYLLNHIDYVLEEEEKEGNWIALAIYIILEYSHYDLKTHILKQQDPLSQDHFLQLLETLIGGNYLLQSDLDMPHGDLRPQNVRVIIKDKNRKDDLEFKLSYLDDILSQNNSFEKLKSDFWAYLAPELLCAPNVVARYQLESEYTSSNELRTLIEECPDEIKYDPFRADVFSAGLILLSAATSSFFGLSKQTPQDCFRDGETEVRNINLLLKKLKSTYNCKGICEIIRLMLNQNPLQRYDFEELAVRINKLRENNLLIPEITLVKQEPALKDEYEMLKQSYFELTEIVDELKDRELEYRSQIDSLTKELSKKQAKNIYNNSLDISAIPMNDDSFISTALTEVDKLVNPTETKKAEEVKKTEKKVIPNLVKKDKTPSVTQEAKESIMKGGKF